MPGQRPEPRTSALEDEDSRRTPAERVPLVSLRCTGEALIVNYSNAVLLVRGAGSEGWRLPGATARGEESSREAAARGTREETGLATVLIHRLVAVDWPPPRQAPAALTCIYHCGRLPDQTPLLDHNARWVTPEQLGTHAPAHLTGRILAARQAHVHGTVAELVDGRHHPF